jgi:hypothetical protein
MSAVSNQAPHFSVQTAARRLQLRIARYPGEIQKGCVRLAHRSLLLCRLERSRFAADAFACPKQAASEIRDALISGASRSVNDLSRRQEVREVKASYANSVVSHPVIDIEAVR